MTQDPPRSSSTSSDGPVAVGPSSSLEEATSPARTAASIASGGNDAGVESKHGRRLGLWDWLGPYLPRYDGPYRVGTVTLELPAPADITAPDCPMRLKSDPSRPAFQLRTIALTIFYPSSPTAPPASFRSRPDWATRPIASTAKGYANLSGAGRLTKGLMMGLAWLIVGRTRVPAYGGAPFAGPGEGEVKAGDEGTTGLKNKRRLIVFSHGLAGGKLTYSQYCGRLASRGFVVACIEHRDGSSAFTSINHPPSSSKPNSKSFEDLVYLRIDDIAPETRPKELLEARAHQLAFRVTELLSAFKLLAGLGKGDGALAAKSDNLRVKGARGWQGDDAIGWTDDEWRKFGNGVDWEENVVLAGHSFGAGTGFALLQHPDRPRSITASILMDPWLEPRSRWPSSAPVLSSRLPFGFPTFVMISPGWTVWKSHYEEKVKLLETGGQSWMVTVAGIVHTTFSDFATLFPRLSMLGGKLKFDPFKAMDTFISLSTSFLGSADSGSRASHNPGFLHDREVEPKGWKGIKERTPGEIVLHVAPSTADRPPNGYHL